jgi:hypothetical protein
MSDVLVVYSAPEPTVLEVDNVSVIMQPPAAVGDVVIPDPVTLSEVVTSVVDEGDTIETEAPADVLVQPPAAPEVQVVESQIPAIDHSNYRDHTQNTDQYLDYGGANEVAVAAVANAALLRHAAHSDDQDLSGLVTKVAASPSPAGYLPEYDATGNLVKSLKTAAMVHDAVTVSGPLALSGQALSLVNNAVSPGTITAIDIDGTLAGNSDIVLATQKAVKTYADTKTTLAAVKADVDIASAISLKHAANHALIDATGHTVSGLTTGHFLKATGATTYGFAAHGLTYSDVGADAAGTGHTEAAAHVSAHESTYNHSQYNTAYTHSQDVTGNVHGADSANTANMIVRRGASGEFSAGVITATGVCATNFYDATAAYNVNLGSGGSEGRGLVAGYTSSNYGGIGYNVRHGPVNWVAPGADLANYLLFQGQAFYFYYMAGGAAGRTISWSLANIYCETVTGNVAGNCSGTAGSAAKWTTARTLTIGSKGQSVDGSAAVTWTLADIGAAAIAQTMYIGTTAIAINRASDALTLAGITLTTPNIGTPSAGVLTNCTGLPQASVVGLTTADGPSFAHLHLADLAAIYTAAESWIGPSSTTGVYFKGGNIGIKTITPLTPLHVAGAMLTSSSTYYKRYTNIASYEAQGVTKTGTLIITLGKGLNAMVKVRISGWSYTNQWDAVVSGYINGSSNAWTQIGDAFLTGDHPFAVSEIRLCYDSATEAAYILIGTTTTTWSYYAMVSVDVEETYVQSVTTTGWTIDINASEPSITSTVTPTINSFGSKTAIMGGNVGIGPNASAPLGVLCIDGGLTVGSMTNAGDNNLRVEGAITCIGTLHVDGATTLAAADMEDTILTRPTIKDYGETINAVGNLTGAKTFDLTLGNIVTGTVTGATTLTFSNPSATGIACSFTFIVTNGAAFVITWPASVDWPGGTAPTLTASGIDILTFITIDAGTTWRGFLAGKDMK